MSQYIDVTVDKKGGVTVEAKGVKGTGCTALTRFIEEALGTVTETEKTAEYYEQADEVKDAVSVGDGQ